MSGGRRSAGAILAALMLVAEAASAQPPPGQSLMSQPSSSGGVEVSFGAALGAPVAIASADANLTRPDGRPLTLFRTSTRFGPGIGGEVGVAGFFSRRLGVEASGYWLRQQLRTEISDDVERAPSVTLAQPIDRMSFEGVLVVMLRQTARTGLFVRAGGGWMQELADGGTLVETGTTATVGVGVKYWFRDRPLGRGTRVGLRMDVRMLARSGGLTLGARSWQFGPTGMAGLVFGF